LTRETAYNNKSSTTYKMNKKCSEETQTLRTACGKAEPKKFVPPQTPFPGEGVEWPKFNQLVWYGIVEFNVPLDTV